MTGGGVVVDGCFCFRVETHLTVHKTSLFFPGDGFIAYDPNGVVIFRVDSYGPNPLPNDEIVLMDASGKCLLTLHRKRPSLHRRWEGFAGERIEEKKPIFSVFKSSIIGRSSVMVDVYKDPAEEYQIEGSFSLRCCTIYNTSLQSPSKDPVAEIKRKVDPTTNVVLGKDVFSLCLAPAFDAAFAMGLVLVLDQMYGDDNDADPNPVSGDPSC